MSSKALSMVIHHSKASPTARHVLTIIAWYDTESGAWPSQETIAEKTGLTTRTVKRAIAELLDIGEIDVIANQGGSNGGRRSNLYVFLLDCPETCDKSFSHRPNRGHLRPLRGHLRQTMGTSTTDFGDTVSPNIYILK